MIWTSYIKGFKSYLLLEKGLSEHSIEAYLRDVGKLESYLQKEGCQSLKSISTADLRDFLAFLNELGLSVNSQARLISGLRTFFKFLQLENVIDTDPCALLEAPKSTRKIPSVLSYEEIIMIIDAIDLSHPQGTRNRAMLETLYACGLRVSELVNLKISNLYFDLGVIKVIGKGNKERLIPIGDEAIKQVNIYRSAIRNHQTIYSEHEDILFLNRRGKKLTRVMVFTLLKKLVETAGIEKTVSPHTFRHSFATHLIEGGADLKAIQDMLGHESITTTEIYTHLDTDFLRETVNRFHPRSNGFKKF